MSVATNKKTKKLEMSNATAFIDQNLAAQLFIAARAHDSLRQEPENLLPTAITEIFSVQTSHAHRVIIIIINTTLTLYSLISYLSN